MSTSSPEQIIRCLKSDIGDLRVAANYAQQISQGAARNPWADPAMAPNYAEAARRLRMELDMQQENNADCE